MGYRTCYDCNNNIVRLFDKRSIELVKQIGEGGSIHLGMIPGIGLVAVKIFSESILKEDINREMTISNQFSHPNIINFIGIGSGGDGDSGNISLIFEFMLGGSIYNDIQNNTNLTYLLKLKRLLGSAQAIHYIHKRNVIHSDIKSENVLICKDGFGNEIIKVCDFGLSWYNTDNTKPINGTLTYAAPEISTGEYNEKVDSYSFGIYAWEVLEQLNPEFADRHYDSNGLTLPFKNTIDIELHHLILQCWYNDRHHLVK